ncbi:MAG: hypothetical protein JWN66_468 [Sphingomonas bacterium]|uniref:DUF3034 family protein n=1 Tax=Sphingomonas bacterium TaxID=1895847 RepID=UPI00262A9823|nr:DUF3034 family protein [Sphingomonas bacterium]MDB5703352.1 hypothetical protein [Sphingomonas bacterium]
MTRRALVALAAILPLHGAAAGELREGGKLVLTGGVSSVEGAAGGGLATWALIAGEETNAGVGGSVHATYIALPDFDLTSYGGAIGFRNRIELSYAHQSFDTRDAGAALGIGRGFTFAQDVFGAKLRLIGDAVYDQDRVIPQISVGMQHKRADKGAIIAAVGGKESRGTDFYIAATKVILSKSLVLNTTLRFTKANQLGLLGFGGDRRNKYRPEFEGSAGVLLTRKLLVGVEYRTKPDNLRFAEENDAYDLFAAWSLTRHVALTAAYVDLGDIAMVKRQHGAFLSIQGSF